MLPRALIWAYNHDRRRLRAVVCQPALTIKKEKYLCSSLHFGGMPSAPPWAAPHFSFFPVHMPRQPPALLASQPHLAVR